MSAGHTQPVFFAVIRARARAQTVAPDTLRLFVRPKRLQYSTFVSIVDTLVGFAGAPESFYDQARGRGGGGGGEQSGVSVCTLP